MSGFLAVLRSDLFIAVRSRWLPLLLLAPAALAAATVGLAKLRAGSEGARAALLGNASTSSGALGGYGPLVDGLSIGFAFGHLAIVGIAACSIASDRDRGTVRHLLVRRASRTSYFLARYASLMGLGLLSILLAGLASWASASLLYDLGPVIEDGLEIIGTAEIHGEIARGVGLALAPLPAALALGLLVSVAARSPAGGVATALGLTLAFDLFKGALGGISRFVYASYIPSLVDRSYLKEVSRIVRGFSDVLVEDETILLNVTVPWPAALLFLFLALAAIRRREL
jgi:hypothetical protein